MITTITLGVRLILSSLLDARSFLLVFDIFLVLFWEYANECKTPTQNILISTAVFHQKPIYPDKELHAPRLPITRPIPFVSTQSDARKDHTFIQCGIFP